MPGPIREAARLWIPTLIGAALTAALIPLCVVLAGAGHGIYAPMIFCFPYSMLLAAVHQSIIQPHIVLAFVQYPVYGALVGRALSRPNPWRVGFGLAAVHTATAAIAVMIAVKERNFWP